MKRRLALAQLAVVVACVLAMSLKWRTLHDFVAAIDHGDGLFADFAHHYWPTVHDSLRQGAPAGGFFYPAGFAALLAPLGFLSLETAKVVWGVVLALCVLVIALPLSHAAAGGKRALALVGAAITTTSIPVLHDLKWGQVSLPIVACAGMAFVLQARGEKKQWPAAALLAIAAGIKGYPLAFLGYWAVKGERRFVVRAGVACFVTLVALPALILGPMHALFVQRVSTNSVLGAADGVLRDFNSQYASAVFARYNGGWDDAPIVDKASSELAGFAALGVIAILVAIVARTKAPRLAERRALLGFVLVASTVPFWLKTSWSHYFVHLPIAQVLLAGMLAETGRMRDRLALVLLIAPSVYLSSVLSLWASEGWWYYANAGSLFFANGLVLLACAGVIVDEHVRSLVDARTDEPQRTRGVEAPVARWSESRATR